VRYFWRNCSYYKWSTKCYDSCKNRPYDTRTSSWRFFDACKKIRAISSNTKGDLSKNPREFFELVASNFSVIQNSLAYLIV
jgi:hypothetical protein